MSKKGRKLMCDLFGRIGDSLNDEEKKLVHDLLDEKVCDLKEELDRIEHQRNSNSTEALKGLIQDHEEQQLDVITSWREAEDAVTLAANLVVRAKATMDRQGWWFRFEEYRCDEDEQDNKLFQVRKGLTLAKKGIAAMVEALRAVEFPNTFADLEK